MNHSENQQKHTSRWIIRLALLAFPVLIYWASVSEVDQMVHARGQVIASSRTQIIQSPDGGVIHQILVKEGDSVKPGQLLATMEKDRAKAGYDDSMAKVAALKIKLTRLRAEMNNEPLKFDQELYNYPQFIKDQEDLYKIRQMTFDADINSLTDMLNLSQKELKMNEPLFETGDISEADLMRLQRGVLETQAKIDERRNRFYQDISTEMAKAQEDLSTQLQGLSERTALLEHTELRAPTDGVVRNIQITTIGGVLRAGDTMMEILPTDSDLIVEFKVSPTDLGFIREGFPAMVKLDSYDYSIYGAMNGTVTYISPDALMEKTQQGEQPYYRVRARIGKKEFRGYRAKDIVIWPGMTVTVDIITGKRSILSYLTKPIIKTLDQSMTER